MSLEVLVTGPAARKMLSPTGDGVPMSRGMFSAIVGAMGKKNARLHSVKDIIAFLKAHPDFTAKGYLRGREYKMGEVVSSQNLPRSMRFVVMGVKNGKPVALELYECET